MHDTAKTGVFVLVAVMLCGWTLLSSPGSSEHIPDRFSDQGEEFYPEFKDPLEAAALEVIAYDEESGTATPFKVQTKDGVWSIPSHYDYPADGEDRLARTAASIIDLQKDVVQSTSSEHHEALGVVDPLDDSALSLKGRGQRITLRNEAGGTLVDFVVGKGVENKDGFYYMRIPDKKRTYQVKADIDLSTKFADWIETNLLDLVSTDVTRLEIRDYSIDEATSRVEIRDTTQLTKGTGNDWVLADLPENQEVDQTAARRIPTALSGIRITGVRPKPESLTEDLRIGQGLKLDLGTQLSLSSKGFFISSDGVLLSNEGEVSAGTQQGVVYTLRFGEVVFGEGLEISSGLSEDQADAAEEDAEQSGEENRYLFVTAGFDDTLLLARPEAPQGYIPTSELDAAADEAGQTEPPGEAQDPPATDTPAESEAADPTTQDADGTEPSEEEAEAAKQEAEEAARRTAEAYESALRDWNTKLEDGRQRAAQLNDRFAGWYYVISGKDFENIKIDRAKLVKDKDPADDLPP